MRVEKINKTTAKLILCGGVGECLFGYNKAMAQYVSHPIGANKVVVTHFDYDEFLNALACAIAPVFFDVLNPLKMGKFVIEKWDAKTKKAIFIGWCYTEPTLFPNNRELELMVKYAMGNTDLCQVKIGKDLNHYDTKFVMGMEVATGTLFYLPKEWDKDKSKWLTAKDECFIRRLDDTDNGFYFTLLDGWCYCPRKDYYEMMRLR